MFGSGLGKGIPFPSPTTEQFCENGLLPKSGGVFLLHEKYCPLHKLTSTLNTKSRQSRLLRGCEWSEMIYSGSVPEFSQLS